jgi:hypothetical protein
MYNSQACSIVSKWLKSTKFTPLSMNIGECNVAKYTHCFIGQNIWNETWQLRKLKLIFFFTVVAHSIPAKFWSAGLHFSELLKGTFQSHWTEQQPTWNKIAAMTNSFRYLHWTFGLTEIWENCKFSQKYMVTSTSSIWNKWPCHVTRLYNAQRLIIWLLMPGSPSQMDKLSMK